MATKTIQSTDIKQYEAAISSVKPGDFIYVDAKLLCGPVLIKYNSHDAPNELNELKIRGEYIQLVGVSVHVLPFDYCIKPQNELVIGPVEELKQLFIKHLGLEVDREKNFVHNRRVDALKKLEDALKQA